MRIEVNEPETQVSVFWKEPTAEVVGNGVPITYNDTGHETGDKFSVGITDVKYTFTSGEAYEEVCHFKVNVVQGKYDL